MLTLRQASAAIAAALLSGTAAAQNVLVNGGFENNPPSGLGNNIGHPVTPWVLGTGQSSNVVKVDGVTSYGTAGPWLDADPATGAGVVQHYLDIADGSNDFYQSFTPQCSDSVVFGGSFSTRGNSPGSANVKIVQGVGPSGPVIGATNTVNLPGGTSATDPWTTVTYSVLVTAGTTYSFVVHMDNNMNFDEGFVRFRTDCDPQPQQDSIPNCCPPWDAARMQSVMSYQGTGGVTGNYTLRFQAAATAAQNVVVNNQLNAYLAYVNTLNPAIVQLRITFTLWDSGIGSTPVPIAQIGPPYVQTWTLGPDSFTPFFPPGVMQVNRWYTVSSAITLHNSRGMPIRFFPRECSVSEMHVRLEVLP
jgi:hypothetical protein